MPKVSLLLMAAAPLRVHAGEGALLVEDARDGGTGSRILLRNGGNGVSVEQYSADAPLPFTANRTEPAQALAGVIQLAQGPYAVLITESAVLGRGPYGATVHRAERWDLVALFSRASSETVRRAEEEYLRLFESVSSTRTFYFSWDLDLTHTTQHALRAGADWQALPRWRRAHSEFTWNYRMLSPFAHCDVSAEALAPFVVPLVNGHVEIHDQCAVRDTPFTLVFVSRRSRFRQGTRFHRRGINAQGHVANFVETEQIAVRRDGRVTAFAQLRGSIPVFWNQPCTLKYAPRVILTDHGPRVSAAFRAHVKRFIDHWGAVVAVNLIDKKKDQKVLGDAFEREVVKFGDPRLRYVWFDFHHECRKMQWHNLAKLLDAVRADVDRFGFLEADAQGRVVRTQQGILRTNCMDNLDRTNVVQSIFARYSLLSQLDAHQPAEDPLESGHTSFENVFKHVWANNADAMSVLYSGTGALKTDFTRTGKRTKQGALQDGINSLRRYYLNNFHDGERQDAFDLFLGELDNKNDAHAATLARPRPLGSLLRHTTFLVFGVAAAFAFLAPLEWGPRSRWTGGVFLAGTIVALNAYLFLKKGLRHGVNYVQQPKLVEDSPVTTPRPEEWVDGPRHP